ncbi:MAG: hypothetical protein HY908_10820 [Myxococcales bacterium]|nr:hypothetical protein [Myxococcales bacterium]
MLAAALAVGGGGCEIVVSHTPRAPAPVAQHHGLPPGVGPTSSPSASAPTAPLAVPAPTGTQLLVPMPTATGGQFEPPPPPLGRPELLPAGLPLGRPPAFAPEAGAGYWLWQGPRGSWMLRTTTGGESHAFSGSVAGTSGAIGDIGPTSAALAERIRRTDVGWEFSFHTAGHADGFTFSVQGGGCVRLDLRLDAAPAVHHVFVGSAQFQPRSAHFIVCPRGQVP